ncbi:Wzz/FepE/Etk N-terminal domain-containing protein, partial [Streptomyces sp. W16]|uniref:Wzz/FepE/Etk N-terminal domain-containing protein n=1 Tax=Streptomyces sp. W16 TaxID=3076631 RepID=UPI00295C157E
MNEDTIRLVTIGRILRRRWRLLAVLAVVGALFGYGTSVLLLPPRYTAEASVLLPGQWEERELLTQVDIATSSAVVDRAAAALKWPGVDGTELQKDVSAKADDGNIIKVSGTADTPERAQRLSDQLAQQFVTFATRIAGGSTDPAADTATEALRKQVAETNRRITDLANSADPGQTVEGVQARTELEGLRTGLQDAMKKLEEANPATAKASMVVMGPAPRPTGAAAPTRTQLIAAGALLFLLLAVAGHLAAARVS